MTGTVTRNKRIEMSPIRYPAHWGDGLVHRTFVADSNAYAKGMVISLCYGRFLNSSQYIVTDDPVTCLVCLSVDLEGPLPPTQDLIEGHQTDIRRRF